MDPTSVPKPTTRLWAKLSRGQRLLWILGIGLSLLALVQGMHRAKKGRNALLKWGPVFEALERGEPIYGVGEEGYPTLPITLLGMAPFHALGPLPGAFCWALSNVFLACWIVWLSLRMAGGGRAREVPWRVQLCVLLLSARILHSEVQHANINLWVASCVLLGAWNWGHGRKGWSGFALGFGAGLKVTPALALVLFARERSMRALSGLAAGLATAVCLPMLWLGAAQTWALTQVWAQQMLLPYLQGRDLQHWQTEHINQSLLGLLARLATTSVAISKQDPWPTSDLRIAWFHLDPAAFQALHLGAVGLVLAFLWWSTARRPAQQPASASLRALGLFALLGLGMLLLSERSWKQHHVLLPMAGSYLAVLSSKALHPELSPRCSRLVRGCLWAAIVLILGSGEGVLGKRGADWAEAYGAYTLATLALTVAVGLALRAAPIVTRPANNPP